MVIRMATDIELIVLRYLDKLKIEYQFQTSLAGGFYELGGAVVDFLLPSRSLAWRIFGEYWHKPIGTSGRDMVQRELLTSMGWIVVDIWGSDIKERLEETMRLALQGREMLH